MDLHLPLLIIPTYSLIAQTQARRNGHVPSQLSTNADQLSRLALHVVPLLDITQVAAPHVFELSHAYSLRTRNSSL